MTLGRFDDDSSDISAGDGIEFTTRAKNRRNRDNEC